MAPFHKNPTFDLSCAATGIYFSNTNMEFKNFQRGGLGKLFKKKLQENGKFFAKSRFFLREKFNTFFLWNYLKFLQILNSSRRGKEKYIPVTTAALIDVAFLASFCWIDDNLNQVAAVFWRSESRLCKLMRERE